MLIPWTHEPVLTAQLLNETNEINEINEIDETDQTDQTDLLS